ncbi:MAG TPA: hypothetical protein VE954_27070 [Oligoflexus sp.]|uniref:hypothetical protein n=1 Tax=Oligoflexus sp. TaxID=1971216 RepID=UPI002D5A232E|nr:hypothetical protein [Oligoflexus sp.]HYX36786.1 hypothetical protein [Oligoflexus sp.]
MSGDPCDQDQFKNLTPPASMNLKYLSRVSAVDYYQAGHVRIAIEIQNGNGCRRHQLSFLVNMKRLDLSSCLALAEKIGPGLGWKVDEKCSRKNRSFRLWCDA